MSPEAKPEKLSGSDTQWPQLRALLEQVLDCAPEHRFQFVQQAEAPSEVRAAVLEMLRIGDANAAVLVQPLMHLLQPATEPMPAQIGPYRLLEEIGSGGMGTVYAGEREQGGFTQKVAIKLIRGALISTTLTKRFLREREILAKLNHPNIAHLLDGGVNESGMPWYAMEFIDGQTLDAYVTTQQLPLIQRLELLISVCNAVQYAHHNLIVHRDLKPANILVTHDGKPKLLDFGVAKFIEESQDLTVSRAPMTLAYAAPEQIRGEQITTACDVYAIGVILYELLTGERPHASRSGDLSLLQAITDTDPILPSTKLARKANALGATEHTTVQAKALRGDLDTIALKALSRDPARRYASAQALSEDLKRYLVNLPILARPDSWAYRARKFVRRNRALSASLGALATSILLGAVVTFYLGRQAQRDAARAVAQAQASESLQRVLSHTFAAADPYQHSGKVFQVQQLLDLAWQRAQSDLRDHPELALSVSSDLAQAYFKAVDQNKGLALHEALIARLDHQLQSTPTMDRAVQLKVRLHYAQALQKLARSDAADSAVQRLKGLLDAVDEGSDLWFEARLAQISQSQDSASTIAQLRTLQAHPAVRNNAQWLLTTQQQLAPALAADELRQPEAQALFARIVQSQRTQGSPLELARALHNMALNGLEHGHTQPQALEEAIAIYTRELGAEHSDTLNARNVLLWTKTTMGDGAGAQAEFEKILQLQRPLNGLHVIATLRNYTSFWMDQRDFKRANALNVEALQRLEKIDPRRQSSLNVWVQIDALWLKLATNTLTDFPMLHSNAKAATSDKTAQSRLQWLWAQYLYQQAQYQQARATLATVLQAPEARARIGRIELLAGKIAWHLGDQLAAQQAFEAALKSEASEPEPLAAWPAEAQYGLALSLAKFDSERARAMRAESTQRIAKLTPLKDPWRRGEFDF